MAWLAASGTAKPTIEIVESPPLSAEASSSSPPQAATTSRLAAAPSANALRNPFFITICPFRPTGIS